MSVITNSPFYDSVGDTPVGTSDTSTWPAILEIARQVNDDCVSGKKMGGVQIAGDGSDLAVVVFGKGAFDDYFSTLYGIGDILEETSSHLALPGHA
ncbi:MAG: hypothetical protein M1830_010371 [Pleopsidium flavum]|nr:MAG: hypothetical protein M1830_010371 [Pleopsidium flavum]